VKSRNYFLIVLLCLALVVSGGIPARAQQASGQHFSQTGHNVIGEFWTFYQSFADAATVFGYPITEQFTTRDGSNLTVQYFERVRFELHPDQPVGQRIQISSLGTQLYLPNSLSVNITTPGACQVFANGLGVCYDFLNFYNQHGGLDRFGNPISAFEFQADGRIVQYFEKARFEWHPDFPAGEKVGLTDFGRMYFNLHEDLIWLNPAPPPSDILVPITPPTSLRTMVFVSKAVTLPTDTQKVFVVVQDQALNPVPGASGTVTVRLPDGQVLSYPIATDANGVGSVSSISFSNQLPGSLAQVDVQVSIWGLSAFTTTSFRIWR
jgi:hypothetical protein